MVHSFSHCPLRSSCLLITNHANQHIVTATDEVLDLLGYTMSDIIDHSIQQCLNLKLSTEISCIPQCKIRHASGRMLNFQVCIHQDPLGSSSCLDYWLIRLSSNTEKLAIPASNAASVLRLSPYGTIEQVQASPVLKQPIHELLGRPVMAFVYKDDVETLCSNLSKICSVHRREPSYNNMDPLFIRWSSLPYLLSTSMRDHEDSLNYNWMSFTLMGNSNNNNNSSSMQRPICILQPLQIPLNNNSSKETPCEESLVLHFSVFDQLLGYYKYVIQMAEESKTYITEFYHHVVFNIMEVLSIFIQQYPALQQQQQPQQQTIGTSCTTSSSSDDDKNNAIWNFIKSNYILQRSLTLLELTGLLDQQACLKTCIETVSH